MFHCNFVCTRNGSFAHEFPEKIAIYFPEKGGGGGRQRLFRNFPEILEKKGFALGRRGEGEYVVALCNIKSSLNSKKSLLI